MCVCVSITQIKNIFSTHKPDMYILFFNHFNFYSFIYLLYIIQVTNYYVPLFLALEIKH